MLKYSKVCFLVYHKKVSDSGNSVFLCVIRVYPKIFVGWKGCMYLGYKGKRWEHIDTYILRSGYSRCELLWVIRYELLWDCYTNEDVI